MPNITLLIWRRTTYKVIRLTILYSKGTFYKVKQTVYYPYLVYKVLIEVYAKNGELSKPKGRVWSTFKMKIEKDDGDLTDSDTD